MLVGSCLLIIIILSFGCPLIPGHQSHNAVRLNLSRQTGCGYRQDISIATFYPIRFLPGSEDLPCTPVTPVGVSCQMTRLKRKPLIIGVNLKAKGCTNVTNVEVKMQVDSTFKVVSGTLSSTNGLNVHPPTTGNTIDLASAISPSVALTNCAAGFIFGTAKILDCKKPTPADCIDAHTGVQGFADHVVIGDGYSDYMTDEEIQQLPAPESRALVAAARNDLVFTNNMYTALSSAYTDAQLLVSDMKYNLIPAPHLPTIEANLGDALIIIGILLPLIPFGPLAPAVGVIGGSLVIAGTLMNEQHEQSDIFDIVSDDRLQNMKDTTQQSFFNLMNNTFLTNQNYTALDVLTGEIPQDLSQMEAQIKQQSVTWAANQFLNYYGLKICDNPDDYTGCGCDDSGWITVCNDKIQNTDCRFAGGFGNGGGGYYYSLPNGTPTGNIAQFTKYLANGSYNDMCNGLNGWSITKGTCGDDDYLTYYDTDQCPNYDPPPEPPCC